MKHGSIIISALLFVALIWRAPVVGIDPSTGAIPSHDIRYMFENAFVWAAVAAFAFFLCIKVNLWVGLFLVLASVSAWFPINSSQSERAQQLVLYGCIWYFLCVQFLNALDARRRILNTICIIALVNIGMILSQGFINFDPIHVAIAPVWDSGSWDRVPNVGLMDCTNSASALLAICSPAFLRKRWIWCLIPLFVAMVLTKTFAGPLAVGVALAVFGIVYLKSRKQVISIVLLCLLLLSGYWMLVDRPDASWRWKTWKIGIDLYTQHWAFGSGIGHWKEVFSTEQMSKAITGNSGRYREFMAHAHNEYVQGIFEMGIGFAILMIGFAVSIFRRYQFEAVLPAAAVLILAVDSFVFFPFHIALLAMIGITWLAMLESSLRAVSLRSV